MKTKGQYDNAYISLPASGEGLGVGLALGPTSPQPLSARGEGGRAFARSCR